MTNTEKIYVKTMIEIHSRRLDNMKYNRKMNSIYWGDDKIEQINQRIEDEDQVIKEFKGLLN